jgi:uncharacterized protein YbjT (DUF2867 family)
MHQAVEGAQAIYHIPPNVHPEEIAIGELLILAAKTSGVETFVFHSVLFPALEAMPHHWQKMRVEEHLIYSGLDFVILQPAAYMQNLFGQWETIHNHGRFTVPYPIETRLSLVDVWDVATVARRVLTEPGHLGATYPIVGTKPLSQVEVARILSDTLDRPVEAVAISIDEWEKDARAAGLDVYRIQNLRKMFRYYEKHGFVGNPKTLSWLLGRSPTSLAEVVEREHRRQVEGEEEH